ASERSRFLRRERPVEGHVHAGSSPSERESGPSENRCELVIQRTRSASDSFGHLVGSVVYRSRPMTGLPSGTVTFLFADLEGSTRLWEQHPEAMPAALVRHDEIVRGAIEGNGGVVFSG